MVSCEHAPRRLCVKPTARLLAIWWMSRYDLAIGPFCLVSAVANTVSDRYFYRLVSYPGITDIVRFVSSYVSGSLRRSQADSYD